MRELAFGEFAGDVLEQVEHEQFLLARTAHEPKLSVGTHRHASAYFCLVLKGGFDETSERGHAACRPGTLVYHPHPDPHEDVLLPEGSVCLNIQLPKDARGSTDERSLVSFGGPLSWIATRLLVNPTVDIVLELARETNRYLAPRTVPDLVRSANRLVGESTDWTAAELASAVDAHPVYLARLYRQTYGHSLKEHLTRNRLRRASVMLAGGDASLAEIALSSGFFDQSHFTTAFRERVGLTPAEFRRCYLS